MLLQAQPHHSSCRPSHITACCEAMPFWRCGELGAVLQGMLFWRCGEAGGDATGDNLLPLPAGTSLAVREKNAPLPERRPGRRSEQAHELARTMLCDTIAAYDLLATNTRLTALRVRCVVAW